MGGTGLEPVTPSLSSCFFGADDLSFSPNFFAQESVREPHSTHFDDLPKRRLCVFFVRRLRVQVDRRSLNLSADTAVLFGRVRQRRGCSLTVLSLASSQAGLHVSTEEEL